MQNKLEDYLPFYIGCKVKWGSDTAVLIDTDKVNCNLFMDGKKYNTSISNIKPYFRLLDSMTEDECEHYNNLSGMMYSLNRLQDQMLTEAACTKYLLDNRFDLFQLIPDGLALNEKDLPVTQ